MTAGWFDITGQYNAVLAGSQRGGGFFPSLPRTASGFARGLSVLFAKPVDAPLRIDEPLFARVKRVARPAHVGAELLAGGPRLKRVAAGAGHGDELVVGVNAFFHGLLDSR